MELIVNSVKLYKVNIFLCIYMYYIFMPRLKYEIKHINLGEGFSDIYVKKKKRVLLSDIFV